MLDIRLLHVAGVLVLLSCTCGHAAHVPRLLPVLTNLRGSSGNNVEGKELIERCSVHYRNATLDHFSWAPSYGDRMYFTQRFFLCDEFWTTFSDGRKGPIFFYAGNEADVTLYLNSTGLMWESAPQFGALLIFAEHRYYGESKPFPEPELRSHMQYLTSEQALADYAELLTDLKARLGAEGCPVIAFGGSYGGMLAAWFRMKYPHIIQGSIAASAPIWTYEGEDPPCDSGSFAKVVTYAASPAGGSAAACVPNARNAWSQLLAWRHKQQDRDVIKAAMRLCPETPLESAGQVWALAYWAQDAWDFMAMGNYPYASAYILNGNGVLPAWPLRVACDAFKDPDLSGEALLTALAESVAVFYNYSAALPCFDYRQGVNNETTEDGDFWDYQWCTEQFMPFSRDGVSDMFWAQPFDEAASIRQCQDTWHVTPRPLWPEIQWGGRNIRTASNILFSNGRLDPWSGGGVLSNLSDTLVALVIEEAAHHLDLMFSQAGDTDYVRQARRTQRSFIRSWVEEGYRLAVDKTHAAQPSHTQLDLSAT